ncbi:MAG: PKD domain-containing protein [Bacteroidetes bacterium]|nr:PKD domain-containing protein [Bacteroidota bacterium]
MHVISNGAEAGCTGTLLDSGGQGAAGYSNNENFTYTLCPDAAGGAISLNFVTFNLSLAGAAPIDAMSIYDGNSTGAPLLGTWTGTALQGQVVSASGSNPSGCLTVVFKSNNTGTGVFAATISCFQPCSRPTAVASYGTGAPKKICPGQAVTFNSGASYAASGFNIASRRWDFGDGTVLNNAPAVVSHTYAQPGAYTAQLYVLDNNGCANNNLVDLVTLVGTKPTFTGTTGATGCSGETLCLNGTVHPTTWNELPNANLGGGVFLPDNVGECFNTTLTFTQFAPGQTLTNINQLLGICVNMEHSFMGDLVIRIISPNGQTVILHQQGGGGTYIGGANDNDEANPQIGTCWNYCWTPNATWGTWAQCASGGATPHVMTGGTPAGPALIPGNYSSVQPLSGLLGSPLNGTWTFQVCDMWALDNGFICDWSLDFDPALYPDLVQFTPVYGANCDSTHWAGPNITSTSANCAQACVSGLAPGSYPYTYTVTDNFGCTYDTTVTVTITPNVTVNAGPDATTCGTPVQLNATVANAPTTTCSYQLWLYDSYGDGWNLNGYVTVTINGVSTNWTLNNSASGYTTLSIPHGAAISLSYHGGGLLAYEQSFALLNSAGTTIYSGTNPANGVVWTGTGSCPGGGMVYTWSPATGLSNPSIANPVATVAGTTQYCVTAYPTGHPACGSTDCITITVDNPPGQGTNSTLTVCGNGAPVNLFNLLGGNPDTGGTWTAPAGSAHNGTFLPGVDLAGTYSYTVTGTGPCGTYTTTSTVTVAVNNPPTAGTESGSAPCRGRA